MRSRSLHHRADWNRFLGSTHAPDGLAVRGVTLTLEAARTLNKNDTGTGSAGQNPGADLRTHLSHRPVVEDATRGGRRPDDLGGLRHGARFHRPLVLRAIGPLPDPVLLPVRQRRVRAGLERPGPVDPGGAADHPVRVRVAGVRARFPVYLLLLPGGVLPGVLAGAFGVRGTRAAREVHRRDQGAADRAEPAPLLLVRGLVRRDPAHLRRDAGVPRAGRELRVRNRLADPAGQRDPAVVLHAGLPLVPAHHRRAAEELLLPPGQVLGLDEGFVAERAAPAVRLDHARHADAERPVHPAGGQRSLRRSKNLQLTERAVVMSDAEVHSDAAASGEPVPAEADRYAYDVVVVGAGGSGLRAAIEARLNGKKTAIISKSLFGKAHTVMAEGGCAAAMGNVNPNDNWQVHFRDTMRGGKFLNNWRMAELHAKEAPDRVWELEAWGAVFDRTKDGKISQRNFGGHEYPRLAHVGDRTGLEMIRSLQQKVVAMQQADAVEFGDPEAMIKVFAETTVTDLMVEEGRIAGAFGYFRDTGRFVLFEAPAVVLATGGIGKTYKVTSNSWEYTGDGHALALRAGAKLLNMEFVQLHPTGMVWPPSVRGLLVTESVRGDGGVLRNSEVKAGRGSPHGGVFLDIASRRPAEYILRRLPSMYHQFKELADVDITKEPMEIGPTAHYVMGGVEVDPDTGAASVPGLFAAGEVSGGMHGSNRLGGNSLSDLLVFGRRSGLGAAEYLAQLGPKLPVPDEGEIAAAEAEALAPLQRPSGENPYTVHSEVQDTMSNLVGLIRREDEVKTALADLEKFKERAESVAVPGERAYNPGWHYSIDLRNMLLVAECVAMAALERQESRGGHTRDDYPEMSPEWRKVNLILTLDGDKIDMVHQPLPVIRPDLLDLFDISELKKYMTKEELAGHREAAALEEGH